MFSVEHPACTARWPAGHYDQETARVQTWFGTEVVKHHRRLTTLVGGVLAAGLTLTGLDEPQPDARVLAERPDLEPHRRRPPLLLIRASKPAG